ncbi:hypothetical protein EP7_003250 [Isosphaeraceae bacterium EP7]
MSKPSTKTISRRIVLGISAYLILTVSGECMAQQRHAPAGGITVNGKFYAGGQFLPNSAGYDGSYGGGVGMGFGGGLAEAINAQPYRATGHDATGYIPPSPRIGGRSKKKRARTTSKPTSASVAVADSQNSTGKGGSQAPGSVTKANSDLAIAKSLIRQGKREAAVDWLLAVRKMEADITTVNEATNLLVGLGRKLNRSDLIELAQEDEPAPDEAALLLLKAGHLESMGKPSEALKAYRLLIQNYPDSPQAKAAKQRIAVIEMSTATSPKTPSPR